GAGRPLRRLQPLERRLQPRAAGGGRRPPGRDEAALPPARPRTGVQLDPADAAPSELPRSPAAAPLVPARRAADVVPVDKKAHCCSNPGLRDWVTAVTNWDTAGFAAGLE